MMSKKILILEAFCAASFYGNVTQARQHQHHSSEHGKLSLNQGKKWNSDAPQRQSMNTLHAEFQKKITSNNIKLYPKQTSNN